MMRRNEDQYIDGTFTWFTGKIESITDPKNLNRVKVRCFGFYADDIAVSDLPWATVMMPVTSASIQGNGGNHHLEVGSWVVGFFRDGPSAQDPMVMGSIATQTNGIQDIPTESSDHNKVYNIQNENIEAIKKHQDENQKKREKLIETKKKLDVSLKQASKNELKEAIKTLESVKSNPNIVPIIEKYKKALKNQEEGKEKKKKKESEIIAAAAKEEEERAALAQEQDRMRTSVPGEKEGEEMQKSLKKQIAEDAQKVKKKNEEAAAATKEADKKKADLKKAQKEADKKIQKSKPNPEHDERMAKWRKAKKVESWIVR